jgi:uncharacterized membrane protein YbhN (UPF0104 family)
MVVVSQPGPPRRLLPAVARWAIVLLIFLFIGRSLVVNWDELSQVELHFDIALLVLSMVILFLWMLGQALIWHLLTVTNGVGIRPTRAIAAWFYSQLGKYLPGKIFLYLGRLHFYVREGKGAGPVTVAFGVEMVGNFAASIFMVLVAVMTADVPALDPYRWLLVVALIGLLASLHPRLIGWLVALAAKVLRRKPFQITMGYGQLLRYVGLYVVNWLVFGLALYVFIRSFYPLEFSSIVYLAGAFSFASMVGILAVFAPSGLGVREGVLAVFLNQVMPTSVALVVSVATRLWLTVIELLSAGVVYLVARFRWGDDQVMTRVSTDGGLEDPGQLPG